MEPILTQLLHDEPKMEVGQMAGSENVKEDENGDHQDCTNGSNPEESERVEPVLSQAMDKKGKGKGKGKSKPKKSKKGNGRKN